MVEGLPSLIASLVQVSGSDLCAHVNSDVLGADHYERRDFLKRGGAQCLLCSDCSYESGWTGS